MNLSHPLIPVQVTQPFGANYNPFYAKAGLSGHTGIDFAGNYGQPIYASCDAEVYSVLNKNNPDPMKFRCVFTIFKDTDNQWYELSYGHCSNIVAIQGQTVKAGDIIGYVGNTGDVWSQGHAITREEKLAGSTLGSHLHFQLRPLILTDASNYTLYDGVQTVMREGQYLAYKLPYIPLAACIDPQPFMAITETDLNQTLPDNIKDKSGVIKAILEAVNKFFAKKN